MSDLEPRVATLDNTFSRLGRKKKKKNYKNYVVIVRLTIYRSELVMHDII